MPVIEKLRSMVGGSEEKRQYEHRCGDCGTEFESPEVNPNDTSCPECGSERIHAA